jgi:hypothetical protein
MYTQWISCNALISLCQYACHRNSVMFAQYWTINRFCSLVFAVKSIKQMYSQSPLTFTIRQDTRILGSRAKEEIDSKGFRRWGTIGITGFLGLCFSDTGQGEGGAYFIGPVTRSSPQLLDKICKCDTSICIVCFPVVHP